MGKRAPKSTAAAAEQQPGLTVETVDITTLSPDPANARKHGEKNLEAIKVSLRRFGQQKPIVVDANNIVRAGNGTLEAARALGWKVISIARSELAGSEMTAFAIADNRTAELAEWDKDELAAELGGLREDGFDLGELGYDEKDLGKLLGEELLEDKVGELGEKYMVVVTCKDEADQLAFLEEMNSAGRECRALIG
ncbi:MAG: ParB N-terminal domain-containing protein [Phycisphaerae bacterium]|nr:ParB N-terminal domain-containing protein [Phycisphaerae bacterium]